MPNKYDKRIWIPLLVLILVLILASVLVNQTDSPSGKVQTTASPQTTTTLKPAYLSTPNAAVEVRVYPTTTTTAPPPAVAKRSTPTPAPPSEPTVTIEPWQMTGNESMEEVICAVFGPHCEHAVMVAKCESGLNPNAVSKTDDYGLFQLNGRNPQRWKDVLWWDESLGLGLGRDAIFNPWVNSYLAYAQSNGGTDFSEWTCG